jgi:hypothetical protein
MKFSKIWKFKIIINFKITSHKNTFLDIFPGIFLVLFALLLLASPYICVPYILCHVFSFSAFEPVTPVT